MRSDDKKAFDITIWSLYQRTRKMTYHQFERWLMEYSESCYEQGIKEGKNYGEGTGGGPAKKDQ